MNKEEPFKIFIVEDDPSYLKFLQYVLSLNPDFVVECFNTGKAVLDNLHKQPNLITLDYSLPDLTGEQVLESIKSFNEQIPVIIISAQEKIGTAVNLLKLGAYDYISKDKETKDRLLNIVNNARKNVILIKEIENLRKEVQGKYDFEAAIKGNSPVMKKVFTLLEKALRTNITVTITGETGTGKEMVAKAIHYNSIRKKKPFVAINLAAIPRDLVESELFGHEKGAFTGALSRRIGKFEEAQGGTLFLDEIGEMELDLQAKLLRVLQEKELVRIGGSELINIDVRILVATHKNLSEEVKKGTFREDLYYRLLGLPIELPPLRDRENDILLLAKYFLDIFCKENQLNITKIDMEASEKLLNYPFPGNVRELKSIIELAAVLSDNNEIKAEDIQTNNLLHDNIQFANFTLKEYTDQLIKQHLEKYDNNVLLVAKKLDIGKSTIYRYLKEMENEES
ncbi:MAG: sigma-54 dependent transcriptional regulator [Cyclobacteriaceae bacterium]|nr:sigma-54 dependent transcriptional regulator [Cyclobacteriaceae bacterium]